MHPIEPAKSAPRAAKSNPRAFKSAQEQPKRAKSDPKASQERPKSTQEHPRAPQKRPRASQRRPKRAPRAPNRGSQGSPERTGAPNRSTQGDLHETLPLRSEINENTAPAQQNRRPEAPRAARSSQPERPGATRTAISSQPGRPRQPDRAIRSQIEPARTHHVARLVAQLTARPPGRQAWSSNFDIDVVLVSSDLNFQGGYKIETAILFCCIDLLPRQTFVSRFFFETFSILAGGRCPPDSPGFSWRGKAHPDPPP